ncbi:PaaI family thioesterase [Peredibacter starrii]|uniref:PaaI family thioesterase n=1 Tax=Peredibacter starrii TaxID=28202 RepID=A0AAX4HU21_9BACT|nr:PaaI family thioesterase [Peredibacter starrii]WPU66429.1 PaaI family thioesterase [Peredibacter starrii]
MKSFTEIFKSINKFDQENELTFEIHSPGSITYKMTVKEKHLSSPNIAHGAVIAGFMDCVLGLSALSEAVTRENLTSTVEFKINYIRPVKLGEELIGTGKVIHKGKSLIISSGEIRVGGELVAVGQGTFNTYPFAKKDFLNDFTSVG